MLKLSFFQRDTIRAMDANATNVVRGVNSAIASSMNNSSVTFNQRDLIFVELN